MVTYVGPVDLEIPCRSRSCASNPSIPTSAMSSLGSDVFTKHLDLSGPVLFLLEKVHNG